MDLIEAVKKYQSEHGLNDTQLAKLVGVDLSMWSRNKSGERPPGKKLLMGIMKNIPELGLMVIDFMRSSDTQGDDHQEA